MILNDDSFLLIAAKHYDTATSASADEFYDDLKRFQYLKRLFKRYDDENDLKIRLILNHLIVIYNCFGPMATNLLFFKLKEYHTALMPFIIMLNYMPEFIEYEGYRIPASSITLDPLIIKELRNITNGS